LTSKQEQFYKRRIVELEKQVAELLKANEALIKKNAELSEQVIELTDKIVKLSRNSSTVNGYAGRLRQQAGSGGHK